MLCSQQVLGERRRIDASAHTHARCFNSVLHENVGSVKQ